MKIVIPIMDFGRAGGDRVLSRIATELVNCGCEVYFVALGSAKDIYYQTTAKILKSKVSSSKNRLVKFVMNNYFLYKKCMELNPDCAIANFHLSAFMVSFLPSRVNKYYYVQAYETVFYKSIFRRLIAFTTYLLPLRKIVNHKNILPGYINNYVEVIPAGIDDEIFYSRSNSGERNIIGIVGREEKRKGTSNIIDEIIGWKNKENITLNIALYLSDEDRLRLDNVNVRYNVIEINNDLDLANFYRLNDIVIATGLVEDGAFHYPCAEAMSCGCAVISNYAPLINTNSLLKIVRFSKNTVIEKLNLYLQMTDAEINEDINANKSLVEKYSWNDIGIKLYSLLKKDIKKA